MWCLPKNMVDTFLGKLRSGEITPEKLSNMSSKERRAYLAEFMGEENAKQSNALFESKLLLKDQQRGIVTWAKQSARMRPQVRRDILSRVNKMTEVLTPENENAFLEDLAAHKLGTTVTMEEAGKIAELAKLSTDKKTVMEGSPRREIGKPATETEMDYGRAQVAFENYVGKLKEKEMSVREYLENPVQGLSRVAGIAKSIKASIDNSALLRQGWKTLWTHNRIWRRNAIKSFNDIWNTFRGREVMDEVRADIISRPNYELMQKAKLATGTVEEVYPGIPKPLEKIPVAGKMYKASENAFTAFVYRTRADVFDKYIQVAEKCDVDLTNKVEIESIGKLVNSLTGRGHLGRLEPVANIINNVLFSPRLLKSQIDTLFLHPTDKMSSFARKQAAVNLLKIVSGTSMILLIANAVAPGSVEKDPRSADFGKIKIGNTRFDVTGGMGSLIVLASRLITSSTKSSVTGKIRKLNEDVYGAMTGMDVIYNFFENKLSPAVAVLKDILEGRDFQGNKPTPLNELINLTVPIIVTNYTELAKDPKSANIVIAMIADALGISTNTYGLEPKQQLKKDLTDKKRAGGNIEKELQKGYEEGTLNRNDILQIKREARLSQEIIDFKYLDFDKGMEAYFDLEEKYKTQAMGILQGKYLRKYKNASIPEKKELREKWTEFLAKKRGK